MSLLNKVQPDTAPAPDTFVITGIPGIGKTTLAASLPRPLFIAVDPGLRGLEHIARFQIGRDFTSFNEIIALLDEAIAARELPYESIVIDTLDALESLIYEDVCADGKVKSIEDYGKGYGKGYTRAREKLEELLQRLGTLSRKHKLIIMILSHVQAKMQKLPDGMEFHRWIMKGNEKFNSVLLGWADNVLFANYEMFQKGKEENKIAIMGERLLFTSETAAYQAKNRWGLPESLPLDWPTLSAAIEENRTPALIERLTALLSTSTIAEEKRSGWLKDIKTLAPDVLRRRIAKLADSQAKPAAS